MLSEIFVAIPYDGFIRVIPPALTPSDNELEPLELLSAYVTKNPNPIVRFHHSAHDPVAAEADILMTEPKKLESIARRLRENHYLVGPVRRTVSDSLAIASLGRLNPRVRESSSRNFVRLLQAIADTLNPC